MQVSLHDVIQQQTVNYIVELYNVWCTLYNVYTLIIWSSLLNRRDKEVSKNKSNL